MFPNVSETMVRMETESLRRLGAYIVSRRIECGFETQADFADAIGISARVLSDIENGKRPAGAGTYARIEQRLRWSPGSIHDIIEGGEPTPAGEMREASFEQQLADLREIAQGLVKRIDDALEGRPPFVVLTRERGATRTKLSPRRDAPPL